MRAPNHQLQCISRSIETCTLALFIKIQFELSYDTVIYSVRSTFQNCGFEVAFYAVLSGVHVDSLRHIKAGTGAGKQLFHTVEYLVYKLFIGSCEVFYT